MISSLGCELDDGSPYGELGRAHFAWHQGAFGCLFGCGDADEPVAAGAQATRMVVNADELPLFEASSSDASVFTAAGDDYVYLHAGEPGTAKVVLSELGVGEDVDRLAINVREVASIEPNPSEQYVERLTVLLGTDVEVRPVLRDRDGERLVGVGGVQYGLTEGISPDSLTLGEAIADFLADALFGDLYERVSIQASQVGQGAIKVTALRGGASALIPVEIVDRDGVTAIELRAHQDQREPGDSLTVGAAVFVGIEYLHGARCVWSLDAADPGIELVGSGPLTAQLSGSGGATIRCAVGSRSESAQVEL